MTGVQENIEELFKFLYACKLLGFLAILGLDLKWFKDAWITVYLLFFKHSAFSWGLKHLLIFFIVLQLSLFYFLNSLGFKKGNLFVHDLEIFGHHFILRQGPCFIR